MPIATPFLLIPPHLRRLALAWRTVSLLCAGVAGVALLLASDESPIPIISWASPTRETMTAMVGAPVVSNLEAMKAIRDAGGYPDDRLPHLNAYRLAFACWLLDHGYLTEAVPE